MVFCVIFKAYAIEMHGVVQRSALKAINAKLNCFILIVAGAEVVSIGDSMDVFFTEIK